MTDRAYTVRELDDLRRVVEHKWLFGSYSLALNNVTSRIYREEEKQKAVEERTRTHMLAGHTAQDLYESETNK